MNKYLLKIKDFFESIKDGFVDVRNMFLEGNYKPFLKPLVVLIVVLVVLKFLNGNAKSSVAEVRNRVEAEKAEINNEEEYKNSKAIYEKLVARLPPEAEKNEWLLAQMVSIFAKNQIETTKTNKHVLEESGIFTLSSVHYEAEMDYYRLGRLVESIENSEYFMRISELLVTRAERNVGTLRVSMRVHTLFAAGGPKKQGT